jgi:hypothetical protein
MDAYGGFIFTCSSEEEEQTLSHYIQNYNSCSVAMNNHELLLGTIELCLFSLDHQSIHYAALMRRSKQVASAKYCLKFLKFAKISPVPLSDLESIFYFYYTQTELFPSDTDTSMEAHITRTTNSVGKRLQPNIWKEIIAYLKKHSSKQAQDLDDLEKIRQLSHQRYSSIGFNILKQEKDATLLALRLFGADYDNILTSWFTQNQQPDLYLQGLEGYHRAREDDTIINDIIQSAKKITPGIENIHSSITGTISIPRSNGQIITIMNANRNKIEDTTGVDLVYYNHSYRSHVMVQYKMMEVEFKQADQQELISSKKSSSNKPKFDKKEFCYRPDEKFKSQIEQMRRLQSLSSEGENTTDSLAYRLNNNGFFFKLCESFEFEPMSSDLAQGLYLPLDYMEMLLQSPNTNGPRGGKRITYANAGRHFSNTLFMDLMQEGLIGSSPNASKIIHNQIHNSLSEGRSLTLAWENL